MFLLLQGCKEQVPEQPPVFAGTKSCIECHEQEYNLWVHSDHDNAMDTATEKTVLGDFNNVVFKHNGFDHKFYKKNGQFFVHTLGPGGKPGDFRIDYTFGIRPLQQYLVPFEKGRYQVLPLTWDTERGTWYNVIDSVYKGQEIHPDDWLYWTNNGQNWNGMCAECHSTNLRKNYDPETHVFNTTWSEIDVSCEACHGPSSRHNAWAAIEEKRRPEITNYGLVVQTSNINSRELVDQCAYCHTRRTSFGDFIHPRDDLFDIINPHLPTVPFYFIDGQILEEDYVYGSFTQSKMHQNNVRCTNCHDAHSLELKFDGNKLCQQCHQKEIYDTYEHHFHKNFNEGGEPLRLANGNIIVAVGEGSLCVNCHMPGRYYMGVDYRRDHSMRIPRPDLSDKLGTPNACTQCHTDQSNQWAASYTEKWYENVKRFHFGETMYHASNGDSMAISMLINLVESPETSPLIKATGLSYFPNFYEPRLNLIAQNMLADKESLVRKEAIRVYFPDDEQDLLNTLSPLLNDSSRMVRMEAAVRLNGLSPSLLDSIQLNALNAAINEYIASNIYSADFAASRHNLGNVYANQNKYEEAINHYKEANRIDDKFYPAMVNLAMIYNRIGQNKEAEELLKEVIASHPDMGDIHYSLGLLLAEVKKYEEALKYLNNAAELIPWNARVYFNKAQLEDFLGQTDNAEKSFRKAIQTEPGNPEFNVSLMRFYLNHQAYSKAKVIVLDLQQKYPDDQSLDEVLNYIESQTNNM